MRNKLMGMMRQEDGQGMVEYGLIIGLIAVVVVVALVVLGPQVAGIFTDISTNF